MHQFVTAIALARLGLTAGAIAVAAAANAAEKVIVGIIKKAFESYA